MNRNLFVIVDGDHVQEWQRRALATLPATDRLTFLSCTDTSAPRRSIRHALYYALERLSVRNPLTRAVPLTGIAASIVARHEFGAGKYGAWQTLPPDILATIRDAKPDAVIKFGMSLLRFPDELTTPVLSWHHGDPDSQRGQAVGFYEMIEGQRTMGQFVQVLGNRPDAGTVVAFAETKVSASSLRATLVEAFAHSPMLLEEVLRNVAAGQAIARTSDGPNDPLPGNALVAKLGLRMAAQTVRRIAYGGFMEKKWVVSTAPVAEPAQAAAIAAGKARFPAAEAWRDAPRGANHTFLADPFFREGTHDLLAEALCATTGKGELVLIEAANGTDPGRRISNEPGHFSYPGSVRDNEVDYIVPEIANWSQPKAYVLEEGGLREAGRLNIAGSPRISDPTFYWHEGQLWLFGNIAENGANALHLWHAKSLFERFEPHPMNPIRVSPRGARMGGAILTSGDRPIRLGQNFVDGYGDGLFAFAIDRLTPDAYHESEIGALRLTDRKGPHTFNLSSDGTQIAFDWYRDRFSPLAGVRRLRNRRR